MNVPVTMSVKAAVLEGYMLYSAGLKKLHKKQHDIQHLVDALKIVTHGTHPSTLLPAFTRLALSRPMMPPQMGAEHDVPARKYTIIRTFTVHNARA
jgi:hypothetical protein